MSISETLKAIQSKIAELTATVTGITTKAAAPISAEQLSDLNNEIKCIKTTLSAAQSDLTAAVATFDGLTTSMTAAQGEIVTLKADLANKTKISAAGASAAAEVAASQTVTSVPAGTDQNASGKSPLEQARAELSTTTEPRKKTELARKIRGLKGISFDADAPLKKA